MRVFEFATLLAGAASFVAIASIGAPTYVADDWTESNPQLIQDRLHENVLADLSTRLTLAQLEEDVPCRLPPSDTEIEHEEIAQHLYAVYAIEDYNRPKAVRFVESSLMRMMQSFEFSVPDWSLGPLQIKPSTAIPYLQAAGGSSEGSLREAANLLLDTCAHGRIGVALIADILERCQGSASSQHICFAEAYNGDASNPTGPSYSDAVQMLVRSSEFVELVDDLNDSAFEITTLNVDRKASLTLGEELEQVRLMEANIPSRDASFADWIRATRRLAEKMTETSNLVDNDECSSDAEPEICAALDDMGLQAAEKWRTLFQMIGSEGAMNHGSPEFGPSSYAIENLAWSLVVNEELRKQFSAEEMIEIGNLLNRGVQRYAQENPRYILTSTIFACVQDHPDLSTAELFELPISGNAQERDSRMICMRAFLTRLLESYPN